MRYDLKSLELAFEFTEDLLKDRTRSNLRRLLIKITKDIGMDGFTWWYGTVDDYEEIDTRPKAWMDIYNDPERQGLYNDPIVKEAILTASPFLWWDVLQRPDLSEGERALMREAAAHGMRDGVHFPVGTMLGKWGCLSFFTDDHAAASEAWALYRLPLTHVAVVCNQFSVDIGMANNKERPNLSRREIATLIALAGGHTRKEAAAVLNVEPSTIDHHTKQIIQKTGATNMFSAGMKIRPTLPPLKKE